MNPSTIWTMYARELPAEAVPVQQVERGAQTIMRLCLGCGQQMPHLVGYKTCILCEMDNDQDITTSGQDDDPA